MKSELMKKKPQESSKEEWVKTWEGSTYVLTPLAQLLTERLKEKSEVVEGDFDSPNHYAKWAFREGQLRAYRDILDLLPKGAREL